MLVPPPPGWLITASRLDLLSKAIRLSEAIRGASVVSVDYRDASPYCLYIDVRHTKGLPLKRKGKVVPVLN
jgi:hypothetical protein